MRKLQLQEKDWDWPCAYPWGFKGTVWLGKGKGGSPNVRDSIPRSKASDEPTPSHDMYSLFIHGAPAVCQVLYSALETGGWEI